MSEPTDMALLAIAQEAIYAKQKTMIDASPVETRIILRALYNAGRDAERAKADAEIEQLRTTLTGVRDDIDNKNRLNTLSIVDVVWHSQIETTVDFINAALANTPSAGGET